MAVLTAGTKLTTSLTTLAFQPSGMSTTDFATLMASIQELPPVAGIGGSNTTQKRAWFTNGRLFLPDNRAPAGIQVNPGDYIAVDGKGWPIIIPGNIFSTSWQHS